jgi:flagellin
VHKHNYQKLARNLQENRSVKNFGLASTMSKINTNMAGVTTLYHLRNKEDAMNQALERISSGLRINNAVDDAAGASLVNRMTSQVKGLEAAIRNAADAVSLTQTAEGALDEVSSILHRMRELSVQAANGVYTGQDRQALQNEVGQLQLELARIAENSTFNAVKMLNGDFTNTAFQIGFQPGDSAILSIENVDPTGLGEYLVDTDQLANSSSTFFPAAFPSVASDKASLTNKIVEGEDLTIFGNVGNVTIDVNGGATAKEIAAAITARKGESGVYADAQTRMNVTFSEVSSAALDTVSFNLYGKNDTAVLIAANVNFGVTNGAAADLSELAAAVNGTSGKTGVTASLSIDKSTMTLISDDGYDVVVENYQLVGVTGPTMNVSGAAEDFTNLTDSSTVFVNNDSSANTTVDYYSPIELTAGTNPDTVGVSGTIKFHSPFVFSVQTGSKGTDEAPTLTVGGEDTNLTANLTQLIIVPDQVTVTDAGSTTGSGMTIEFRTDSTGDLLTPVRILNMGSGFSYGDQISIPNTITGHASNPTTITLTAPTGHSSGDEIVTPGGLFSGNPPGAVLSSVSQLDVLNVSNSLKMLTAVDGALVRIDLERSDLGATMSRMEHTINNLSNIVMNTKAARSRINDADIAAESTELSKAQVLNQAAQAMLAQANKAQQSILQLLN